MGIGLTLVETVNVSVSSGESIAISGTAIESAVITVGVPVVRRDTIVGTIQVCWVGFRLSLGKGGKGENYDSLRKKCLWFERQRKGSLD